MMKIDKIFFVGLGGAGQRHLRIFKELLPEKTEFSAYRSVKKTPLLNSNFTVNKDSSLEEKYNLALFDSLEDGLVNNPDLIVISTPSSLHLQVARKAAERGINIFIEKPFSNNLDGFEDFRNLVLRNNLYFFVSFQRRFHPYITKVKQMVSNGQLGKIVSASFNVASYVPDWHPYEDYKNLYACRKELGGGVLLTEIHELDLCSWYFGFPEHVYCAGGNYSSHQLDVEDTAHVTLEYKDFSVQINLCFMQKQNRRAFSIAGTQGY
ncbi:MAG: Gfo/Idh/MocA family oxidoreductase, partial [Bacteroidia bacterium]|nr:Gfo/Idh/MocA family oxidoreductase [Bacteroidia bacterium]